MTSRARRGKKKNDYKLKTKNDATELEKLLKFNIYSYFKNEEIVEVKSVLKIKDMNEFPLVIGSVILNKPKLLKKLCKEGYNLNEVGPNNSTPLIWAIKYKYLDIIEFLLVNGVDPTIRTANGENCLIVALEHKLWNEQMFMNLWETVQKICKMDVNITNKHGHSMLHIAVRRDWEVIVDVLIVERIDVDAGNVNGVTPLMMACFRNNLNIVNTLINAGANVLKEDHHGRLALCYAISSDLKNSRPPYPVAERIITEVKKQLTYKQYLKRRLEFMFSEKSDISLPATETFINIIQFTVQFIENGLTMLISLKIIEQLHKAMKRTLGCEHLMKFFLTLCIEILFYNEQSIYFSFDNQYQVVDKIISIGIPSICLEILENSKKFTSCASNAFYLLLLLSTSNEPGQNWFKNNFNQFQNIYKKLPSDCLNNFQQDFLEEKRLKLMKKKMKKFKRHIQYGDSIPPEVVAQFQNHNNDPRKIEITKKTKRRSKAIKTKITKIKCTEISELVQIQPKICVIEQKPVEKATKIEIINNQNNIPPLQLFETNKYWKPNLEFVDSILKEEQNPITNSLLEFLERSNDSSRQKQEKINNPTYPDWKLKIVNLPFDDYTSTIKDIQIDKEKLREASLCLKQLSNGKKSPPRNINYMVNIITDYLTILLQIIIQKYQRYWENDKKDCWNNWDTSDAQKNLEKLEKQMIEELEKNFEELITSIKDLVYKNISCCYKNIYQLEKTLLQFDIRGKSILSEIGHLETVKIKHSNLPYNEKENFLLNYIEDVLNDKQEPREDVKIVVSEEQFEFLSTECPTQIYFKDLNYLTSKSTYVREENIEVKQKTLNYAYHLLPSLVDFCKSDEEIEEDSQQQCLPLLMKSTESNFHPINKYMSKWAESIELLKKTEDNKRKLLGDIRICLRPGKYQNYIISQGGNFNPVILGLNNNNQPLAIKRIPKEHPVCKTMRSLVIPLLGLRNTHILHYYVCDFENNELILATPLCEFNIGQYVLQMKEGICTNFNLSGMDVIQQFLSGIRFLHQRKEPIVHGNLKPSNIFVDLNGIVRVAEFGTHEALYKIVEAPNTSLIWFASETYRIYKKTSLMECTCASDIQVAGMLIYFILSDGTHPYGSNVVSILKNLDNSTLELPRQDDAIFLDLVKWMMTYNPDDRPDIDQVLSHVTFWTSNRKWRFILNCAGINHHGYPISMNLKELHEAIDKRAVQDNIVGPWIDAIRMKFPNIQVQGSDTLSGLLNFIRYHYEQQSHSELREAELCNFILTNFPTFPLTLYTILDAIGWLHQPQFLAFTTVDLLSP